MHYIGPHVSTQGGVSKAPANAKKTGATGFALFVKNQQQWRVPPLAMGEAEAFKDALRENGYTPGRVLAHAGYLINIANPDHDKQMRAVDSLVAELRRCHALGLDALVLHPGSHLKLMDTPGALRRAAEAVNFALNESEGVRVVLENTAGQGGCLGGPLRDLAAVLEGVGDTARAGVCLDTCHAFAAGINMRGPENAVKFLDEAFRLFGPGMLAGMHFNDTQSECGSHLDRHAPLGAGKLGWETFHALLGDGRTDNIPVILETPEEELWPAEIRALTGRGC